MKNLSLLLLAAATFAACGQPEPKQTGQTAVPPMEDTLAQMPGGGPRPSESTNEQLFQTAFSAFRTAAAAGDYATVEKMVRFPLQTAPKWSDEDAGTADPAGGEVSQNQFGRYRDKIFHPDVKNILSKEGHEQVREIPVGSEDNYYRRLRPGLDNAAPLYEVYYQYPEKNGTAESHFAFIFGKVGTEYKVTGFYSKWPVREK